MCEKANEKAIHVPYGAMRDALLVVAGIAVWPVLLCLIWLGLEVADRCTGRISDDDYSL